MSDGRIWRSEASERGDFFASWTDVPDSYRNLEDGGMTVNMAITILGEGGIPKKAEARRGKGAMMGAGSGSGAWCHHDIGGLGTSAAINVALCGVLMAPEHQGTLDDYWRGRIAHAAFVLGNEVIGIKGGKQDEYASAFGGVLSLVFRPDDTVEVERLEIPPRMMVYLQSHLILLNTGKPRSSSPIHEKVWGNLDRSLPIMRDMIAIAKDGRQALLEADIPAFGDLLDRTCARQFTLDDEIADERITKALDALRRRDILLGGKPCGAGGGGAMMALIKEGEQRKAVKVLAGLGYGQVLDWKPDFEGLRVWEEEYPERRGW